jgi:hypothetical protein
LRWITLLWAELNSLDVTARFLPSTAASIGVAVIDGKIHVIGGRGLDAGGGRNPRGRISHPCPCRKTYALK